MEKAGNILWGPTWSLEGRQHLGQHPCHPTWIQNKSGGLSVAQGL